ncbi:MAG: transcriptional regulator PpsR [Betaproteobacteria bacterium]
MTTGQQRAIVAQRDDVSAVKTGEGTSPKFPGNIDVGAAAALISASADITLIIDPLGVVKAMHTTADFDRDGFSNLVGRKWEESVTIETKSKIASLLADAVEFSALTTAKTKWRQVNHPTAKGMDIPILYSAMKADASGSVIAFGRDLRATAALQQRLVDAQHSMERDYWRLRNAETRYRLLFQMSSEAVLVIDANSQKIIEANPSVSKMLGDISMPIVGQRFPSGFDQRSVDTIEAMFARVRSNGRAEEASVWLSSRGGLTTNANALASSGASEYFISASIFRHEQQSLLLVRVSQTPADPRVDGEAKSVLDAVARAADGFVVSTVTGTIIWANQAFAELAHTSGHDKLRGEPLDRWLGRNDVEFNVLMANLKQRGAVRLFSAGMRGDDSLAAEIEVSAVVLPASNPPAMAFTVRNIGGRLTPRSSILGSGYDNGSANGLPSPSVAAVTAPVGPTSRSVEQLTALVGRVPLKELVGETTDLIEKLCIEAALGLTEDNRAAAAEMLGLSRQSLYVKMRRHGLGDLPPDDQDVVTN